ncbi:MAG: hypothetical protein ACREFO_17725 [Acetobacteraceae bacterium]
MSICKALLLAADKVAEEIEQAMDGSPARRPDGRPVRPSGKERSGVEAA